jgi:hypothetical protein
MKLDNLAKYSLIATALSLSTNSWLGTTGSAHAFSLGGGSKQSNQQATTTVSTPQIDAAEKRVETAKTNLDLARKRLDANKSLVKAAEAEFKAAKTEKDALVLNTQAQQLADASGIPKNGENAPVPATNTSNVPVLEGAAPLHSGSPVYNNNENTIEFADQGAPAPNIH